MACKFFAKNGKPSILYDSLYKGYGARRAEATVLYTRTPGFLAEFKEYPTDENGEPTKEWLKSKGLVYTSPQLIQRTPNQVDEQTKVANLQSSFAAAGIPVAVEVDYDSPNPGEVKKVGDKVTVTINPTKLQSDTIYHEFGHILIEGLGNNDPLVQSGIAQLEGTDLWNAVAFLNPDLSGIRLAKEVLTSAIGVEATKLHADKGKQAMWKIWLNTLWEKLGKLWGVKPDAVRELAKQLVQPNLDVRLNSKLEDYHEFQRGFRIVKNNFATKHEVIDKAIAILEQKIHDYFSRLPEAERQANDHYRKFTEVRDNMRRLQTLDANQAIVEFLSFAYKQTGDLEMRINNVIQNVHPNQPVVVDPRLIKNIMNYNAVFGDILDDFVLLAGSDQVLKDTLQNITNLKGPAGTTTVLTLDGSLYSNIQEIRERYLRTMTGAKRVGIMYLANKMMTTGNKTKFEQHLRDQMLRDWTTSNRDRLTAANAAERKALEKERAEFVEANIAGMKRRVNDPAHFSRFEELANEYYINFLQQSPGDISWVERMFLSGNSVNEETIQFGSELLDEADFQTRTNSIREFRTALPIFEAFDAATSGSSQEERHGMMLEDEIEFDYENFTFTITGRKRQQMVGRYRSQYYEIKTTMKRAADKAAEVHGQNSQEARDALRSYYAFLNNNAQKVSKPDGSYYYIPQPQWINPQYSNAQGTGIMDLAADNPIRMAYDYLIARLEADDVNLPGAHKLIYEDDAGNKYYRIPAVVKRSQIEVVGDVGVGGYMKHMARRVKNAVSGNPEDSAEYGDDPMNQVPNEFNRILQVQADENGRERHYVPVNLRRPVSHEDQSFDLFTITLLNHAMVQNFENKTEIATELELLHNVMESRETVRTDSILFKGTRQKVNSILAGVGVKLTPITDDAQSTNILKAFENMMETRLYGLQSKGSVAANEIAQALANWTGTLLLSMNYLSAGANLMSGQLQTRIEAMGGQHVTNSDLNFAHLEYMKNLKAMAGDMGRSLPESKIGKIVELLNPKSDWEPVANKFVRNSVMKRLWSHLDPGGLQTAGEHAIQTTVAVAVLRNAKALSTNGKYLNKEFAETDNAAEAISLYEAYTAVDQYGIIALHDAVAGMEKGGIRVMERDKINFVIGRFIKELNKSLNGNYDRNEIAEARRTPVGKLAMVMRRWYPYTLTRRVRGITTVRRSSKDLDMDEFYYNKALDATEEGYYTTYLRFIGQTWKEAKRIKLAEGRKGGLGFIQSLRAARANTKADMLEYESSNMNRMYYDIAATFLYMALASVLVLAAKVWPDKDDPRRKATFVLAYWILKAQRELMSYYNPNEILRTVGTVSVVLPQIQQMVELVLQLGEDVGGQIIDPFSLERYERGKRKGQTKLWKEFTDVFPILKQTSKDVEEQFSYMMNVKGW